jgi:glycosyltransferase involved in cell wall biosynthesis
MPEPRRALVLSSLGRDSGCALRARNVAKALRLQGLDVVMVEPALPNLPFGLESLLLLPWHCLAMLAQRPDLAIGIKPYPDVWLPLALAKTWGCLSCADVDDLDGAWRQGFAAWLLSASQAPAWQLLDCFSSHHPVLLDEIKARVPKAQVIELAQGVDTGIFCPGPKASPFPGRRLLLHPAHLNIASEAPRLLECLAGWLKAHPQALLVLAGGGPVLRRIQAQVRALGLQSSVHCTGQQTPQEIAKLMRACDWVLAPYGPGAGNQHRVPMKVGEALACQAKVLTQPIPGLAPLAPWLYMAEEGYEGFAAALDACWDQQGDGREAQGAKLVAEAYSLQAMGRGIIKELG